MSDRRVADRRCESGTPSGDEALRHAHVPDQPTELVQRWPVEKTIPSVVRDADLMAMLGLKHSRYCELKARGDFNFLKLNPQPAGNTLFSGHLVKLWLRGTLRTPDQPRHFFRTAHAGPGRPRKTPHHSPSPQRAPDAVSERAPRTPQSAGEVVQLGGRI